MGKKPTIPEIKSDIPVVTIPTEFYAGSNPTITFKQVEKIITPKPVAPVMPAADKKAFDKATATGANDPLHPVHLFSSRKKIFIITGGLFLVFVAVGGGYVWWQTSQATKNKIPPAPKVTIVKPPEPVVVVTPIVIPAPEVTQASTTPNLGGLIEFPSQLLGKAEDADRDGLTDPEEELFRSDPGVPDTDEDAYLDGSEVFHLYNPVGKEPIKLIESGTVKEYINPVFGYALYQPVNWAVGNVDAEHRDVLFSTISGDNIEVKVFDKDPQLTFTEWLAVNAPSERFGDIVEMTNRYGDPGQKRFDDLVYYFVAPTRIYIVVYHTNNGTVVNYPGVIELMARSFRRDSSKELVIPVQVPSTVETTTITTTAPEIRGPVTSTEIGLQSATSTGTPL